MQQDQTPPILNPQARPPERIGSAQSMLIRRRVKNPDRYIHEAVGAPPSKVGTYYFVSPYPNSRFDFSTFNSAENGYCVTDLQVALLESAVNGRGRPRSTLGLQLNLLLVLQFIFFTGVFIAHIISSLLHLSKYSIRDRVTSASSTSSSPKVYSSSYIVDKADTNRLVAEFVLSFLVNVVTGIIVFLQLTNRATQASRKVQARRKKYLTDICEYNKIQVFQSRSHTVDLTVSPEASYICMKITPKPTDLL